MNRLDAIRQIDDWYSSGSEDYVEFMRLVKQVAECSAKDEREECAKIAQETICDTHIPTGINIYGTRAAKAIRNRK